MFGTVRSAFARARERASRRRAVLLLDRQSDHLLKDIGITRGDLRRVVICGDDGRR